MHQPADTDRPPLAGGPETFDDFYTREHQSLVALAYTLCGSTGYAEDLVQDAFVSALDRWHRITNPSGWIRRVVTNKSVSLFRRRATEARYLLLGHLPDPSPDPELHREVRELWAEVRMLPRRQAQAIALRYVDGATIAEVAEILDLSENTVKTHLQRAKQTLAEHREIQP